MKRLLALAVGLFGMRALLQRRRRELPSATPADDLRAKLAETQTADGAPETVGDVDTLRADVHARARQAIDDLS